MLNNLCCKGIKATVEGINSMGLVASGALGLCLMTNITHQLRDVR